jgi:hypothetical protein
MSIMRLCVVAVICAAAFAAAVDTSGMCTAPTSTKRLYANTTSGMCTAAEACHAAYCTCVGGSRTANTGLSCMSGTANCSTTSMCVSVVTACLNTASDNTACTYLRDLHLSILDVESGASLFNNSAAYIGCKYTACMLVNATAGSMCNLTYMDLCPSPVSFIGTLILTGSFGFQQFLVTPAVRRLFATALATDLARALGISVVRLLRLWIHGEAIPARCTGAACRRAGSEKLVSEFEAVGVSGNNAALKSNMAALKSGDSAWLASTLTYVKTVDSTAQISFGGISAGGVSSAFASQGGLSAAVVAVPTTGGSTTASTTGGGTPPTTGSGTTTSGAAVQSILAAVMVAVMSAMLF